MLDAGAQAEGAYKRALLFGLTQIAALLPSEARTAVRAVIVGVGPGSYSGIRAAAGAAASIARRLISASIW